MSVGDGKRHEDILDAATWHFKNFPVTGREGSEEATRAYMDSLCFLSETIYACLAATYTEGFEDAKGKPQ